MITKELLLEKGYKEFDDVLYGSKLYQKRVRNEKGQTKYFIDFHDVTRCCDDEEWEVHLQFEKTCYTMNIQIFSIMKAMTIDDIEEDVKEIWESLDCKYYDCEVD